MTAGRTRLARADAAAPARPHGQLVRILGGELAIVLATMIASLALLVLVLRLWRMSFGVPLAYRGDATFYLMLVKNLIQHGGYLTNPGLGAPFGQQLYDFPQGADNLNLLVIRLIGLFTNDPAVAMNVFFLLTFPVVALSALLVLRRLGLSRAAAFVCAVLFSLLPYHFWHGENHLLLSAYWAVPLGAYLALVTLDGGTLYARRKDGNNVTRWLSRRSLATIAICVIAGSTGLYYAAFTILLVVAAAVAVAVVRRDRGALASGLTAAATVATVLVINLSPSVLHTWSHGKNPVVPGRQPRESEFYALKLTELLLPTDDHRLALLRRTSSRYDTSTVLPENEAEASGQALGTIADVGFVALVFVALASCVAAPRRRGPPVLGHASFATMVAFLFGTVSGFATIFAYFVSPDLHVPGRISIFIAFFSLLAVGVLIDAATARLASTSTHKPWLVLAAVTLVVFGAADQTTNTFVTAWQGVKPSWRNDAAFGNAVERVLPRGSMVFQLPYTAFPLMAPPGRMLVYDQGNLDVHTRGLRLSYGAMQGRPQDWSASLSTFSPRELVPAVASAGFDAIHVDRYGYLDNGNAIERVLRGYLGSPIVSSADGRYVLYDLRRYMARLRARVPAATLAAARRSTLEPVGVSMNDGFYPPETNGTTTWQWSSAPTVRVRLVNPATSPRTVVFLTQLASRAAAGRVFVRYPDGTSSHPKVSTGQTEIRRILTVEPGTTSVEIKTTAPAAAGAPGDPRTLYLQFIGTRVLDPALLNLARS